MVEQHQGKLDQILEFDKLKQVISSFVQSDPGRDAVQGLCALSGFEAVERRLAEAGEMMALLDHRCVPPLQGTPRLRELLMQIRAEGSFLAAPDLLRVRDAAESAKRCRSFFSNLDAAPLLGEIASALVPQTVLLREIRESIGGRGEILDSASFELGELRQDAARVRTNIRRALDALLSAPNLVSVFQERLITERGGRYVVPLKADCRGRVKGFIHDESASGQTLFIEPASTLEENNRLQSLIRQERREEERILRRLWQQVRQRSSELLSNEAILAHLDLLFALGTFALKAEACIPVLDSEPGFDLRNSRHPLLLFEPGGQLRQGPVVPVDLILEPGQDTLIISGPNTGGKTVTLKTLGLFALMVKSGVPLPCSPGSRIYPFGRLFADIGDEQSIEQSLSTFSGHLVRLRRVLEEADADSLVLLDEAGTGTDPAEGGALCLAMLDSLRQKGARVALTTHLNMVKGYALLHPQVETAAVEFDPRTLAPTYRLHYGIPGASKAFAIARNLGISEEILERARDYLGQGESQGLELVEELNRLRAELEADRCQARVLRERAQVDSEHRRALLQELEEKKSTILERARQKGEEVIRETRARVRRTLDRTDEVMSARKQAEVATDLGELKRELDALRTPAPRPHLPPRELELGERVKIPSLKTEARVVAIKGKMVELDLAGKKMRLPLANLEAFSPRRFDRPASVAKVTGRVERDDFTPRLMLVGQRAEAALQLLERFLDDALLQGALSLEIVHGAGEGILRRCVRDYLAGNRAVVSYHAADLKQGGNNVTLVELRG